MLAVFGAIGLALVVTVTSQAASVVGHTNYLTFSGAVALPGMVLPAGTYTFSIANPNTSANAVRVSSRDGRFSPRFHAARAAAGGTAEGPHGVTGRVESGHVTADPRLVPSGSPSGHRFIYR